MIYTYKNISKLLIFLWEYVLQRMEKDMSPFFLRTSMLSENCLKAVCILVLLTGFPASLLPNYGTL